MDCTLPLLHRTPLQELDAAGGVKTLSLCGRASRSPLDNMLEHGLGCARRVAHGIKHVDFVEKNEAPRGPAVVDQVVLGSPNSAEIPAGASNAADEYERLSMRVCRLCIRAALCGAIACPLSVLLPFYFQLQRHQLLGGIG